MSKSAGAKSRLRRELIVTLLLKLAAITVLWYLFFSSPLDDRLDGPQVGDTLFGTPGSAPMSSSLHFTEEKKR